MSSTGTPTFRRVLFFAASFTLSTVTVSCSHVVYQPAPVVPTKSPLPYSAKVKLLHVDTYLVEPGATMMTDWRIENHVTDTTTSTPSQRKEWEKSIADYLAARKTFKYLSMDSQADVDLAMRLNVYIDPGRLFQYSHMYVARVDATLVNPRTGRTLSYLGQGKARGDVARGGKEDDQAPLNSAVQAALNDLFGKIETDTKLRS